jgi:hypothetical protein
VKGETVHAVFAEIEHHRAEQDHDGLQHHDAAQPGDYFGDHTQQQRRDAAMTKKYRKHTGQLANTRGSRCHPAE